MKLDRTTAPKYSQVDTVNFYHPEKRILSNGVPLYIFNEGSDEMMKVELVFKAGNWYQSQPLVAASCNSMLVEGTKNRTSRQIAEEIDFYGAYMGTDIDKDFASISLYTLTKYLEKTVPVIEDMIKNSVFSEKEFEVYRKNRKQQFIVNSSKVANIARMNFAEAVFGKEHPYGLKPEVEDYDTLSRDEVMAFYKKMYHSANCMIILAGKVGEEQIQLFEKTFGTDSWGSQDALEEKECSVGDIACERKLFPKENAMQSALRIGCRMFNREHEDYHKMQVVMTLLGGYFGSRLMTNIREDKGYTYGIGAALVSFKKEGYLFVASEVGVEVREKAIQEIYFEMERLKTEKVGEDELALVKNYMLGSLLRSIDGVFPYAEKYKTILLNDLPEDYYDRFVEVIQQISVDEVQQLANKYLDKNKMVEIIAG